MSKTARMVMKIVGASLAFAAFVCLLIGGWHDLSVGCCGMKKRLTQRFGSEYDDYADDELLSLIHKQPDRPSDCVNLYLDKTGISW